MDKLFFVCVFTVLKAWLQSVNGSMSQIPSILLHSESIINTAL